MLAANLPVCQYAGMPGRTNNNLGSNNNNNTNNSNLCANSSNSNPNSNGNSVIGLVGGGTSTSAAKNQLEQLNTMREALFSQDGWGCQHVNQDTNWEIPNSPEPTNKESAGGPALWKPTVNNGTDLWESNLRNGGQPPAQPIQKTPWGHTPSSNLGGTWGEDDDATESGSVWSGSSSNVVAPVPIAASSVVPTGPSTGSQWGQTATGPIAGSGTIVSTTGSVSGIVAGSTNATNVPTNAGAGTGGNVGNGWGDPREMRSMGTAMDMRNVDSRDSIRAASAGDPRMIDHRDSIRGDPRGISGRLNGTSEMWGQHHPISHSQITNMNKIVGPGGVSSSTNVPTAVVPGGVSNIGSGVSILNTTGASSAVGGQWGGGAQTIVGSKDITTMSKQISGWEEPSPPPQRRNIPNYDDGTSLWSQQARGVSGGVSSHWKDISEPMNRNHLMRSNIGNHSANSSNGGIAVSGLGGGSAITMTNTQQANVGGPNIVTVAGNPNNPMVGVGPPGRLSSAVVAGSTGVSQHKTETSMWTHSVNPTGGGRNTGSWVADDNNHNLGSGSNWVDDKSSSNITQISSTTVATGSNSWNDTQPGWNKNQTKLNTGAAGNWSASGNESNDMNSEWNNHGGIVKPQQQQQKLGINVDMMKQSKPYRILIESGFKKDDVERALIANNMNLEESAEMLRVDSWRRHDENLGYSDHIAGAPGYPGRYATAGSQPTLSFPPNTLLNNMGGNTVGTISNNHNLTVLNSMQSLPMQKFLNQGPHNVSAPQTVNAGSITFGPGTNATGANVNLASSGNNQPSAQQLRMLVQQIQLAVQSGYLSSQILNQPLAPSTLLLLNNLLSNIKQLQGAQQSLSRGNNSNNLQINVAIAKFKQQIQNLQSQINAQQAIYVKQQALQNPQHPSTTGANANSDYMRGQHDALNAIHGNFTEMSLNKANTYQSTPNQQSRLNQWKLPVLEKEMSSESAEFSRAPGTSKQTLAGNNMGPLGLQSDGTWSTARNIGDGWPDTSNDNESKDWSVVQSVPSTNYTDLVQEFEPGKPWKGSQIKNIEDDPSITPGSVARSPLSINPTPKDADIFANASKNSPTDLPPLSLSSSTWSFNPSSGNQTFASWSDNSQQSELWGAAMNKPSRGPPPGLSSNKCSGVGTSVINAITNPSTVVSGTSSSWLMGSSGSARINANTNWSSTNSSWNSNWLLLKNLTPQIDGSTLRTLCMQHGPLVTFHLYLNQGIALCKYATREEANKAQMTLNNCVLGNSTICAESPNENEVHNILQHLPPSSNLSSSAASGGGSGSGGNVSSNSAVNSSGGASLSSGSVSNNSITTSNITGGNTSASCGNPANNIATNSSGNNNSQIQQSSCNTAASTANNGANINSNAGNCSSSGNSNANNTTWRQQNTQQNQSRPSGRETDFDYISKYVCSIVDD